MKAKKSSNKIVEKNMEAINNFLSWYGSERKAVDTVSTFLFEMQACFTVHEAHCNEEYTLDCVTNFGMLHQLVRALKSIEN